VELATCLAQRVHWQKTLPFFGAAAITWQFDLPKTAISAIMAIN